MWGSGSGGRNPPAMLRKGDGWPKNEFWQKIIAIYVASPASPLCPTCRLLPMEVRVPFRPTSCRAGLAVPSRPAATPEAVQANHRLVITTFGTFDSRGGLALPSMAGHGSGETAQGALQTALRREQYSGRIVSPGTRAIAAISPHPYPRWGLSVCLSVCRGCPGCALRPPALSSLGLPRTHAHR